ncbi:MAG TPA: hypothetical protein VKU88_08315, partial [Acidimicrobiales bacterium]|nr:hypothetical protein [Acidimicrobiales bacterium]
MKRPHDHISDAELSAMTSDMDQLHRDQTMPAMQAAVGEWAESIKESELGITARRTSRRTFLLGVAGAGVGGVLLAACGSSSKSSSSATTVP